MSTLTRSPAPALPHRVDLAARAPGDDPQPLSPMTGGGRSSPSRVPHPRTESGIGLVIGASPARSGGVSGAAASILRSTDGFGRRRSVGPGDPSTAGGALPQGEGGREGGGKSGESGPRSGISEDEFGATSNVQNHRAGAG